MCFHWTPTELKYSHGQKSWHLCISENLMFRFSKKIVVIKTFCINLFICLSSNKKHRVKLDIIYTKLGMNKSIGILWNLKTCISNMWCFNLDYSSPVSIVTDELEVNWRSQKSAKNCLRTLEIKLLKSMVHLRVTKIFLFLWPQYAK